MVSQISFKLFQLVQMFHITVSESMMYHDVMYHHLKKQLV